MAKMKQKVLAAAKDAGIKSALENRGILCRFYFHQPKMPKALLEKK